MLVYFYYIWANNKGYIPILHVISVRIHLLDFVTKRVVFKKLPFSIVLTNNVLIVIFCLLSCRISPLSVLQWK